MATVTGLTATRMLAIEAASVVSGSIDDAGQVTFTTHDGTELDGGNIMPTVPDSSSTVKGIVELATDAEIATGTDTVRAITPAGLAIPLAGKQPLDTDLTVIAALTGKVSGDILQYKTGAWTHRTPAQVKTDLVLVASDVGLGSVTNTADTAKPVSTAQQTALDLKLDKSTLTTKGDLYVATAASTPARVAIGSNNQVLTADSTQTPGVRWSTPVVSGAWWPRARGGSWYPLTGYGTVGGTASGTLVSNQEYVMPMVFGFNGNITGIAINKTSATGNIRLGIRADNGSMAPGVVLFDSGAKGTSVAVIASTAITGVAVTPGIPFWFSVTSQGATGDVTMQSIMHPFIASVGTTTPSAVDFTTNQPGMYTQTGVSAALPGTFTIAGTGGNGSQATIVVKIQFGSVTQGP